MIRSVESRVPVEFPFGDMSVLVKGELTVNHDGTISLTCSHKNGAATLIKNLMSNTEVIVRFEYLPAVESEK